MCSYDGNREQEILEGTNPPSYLTLFGNVVSLQQTCSITVNYMEMVTLQIVMSPGAKHSRGPLSCGTKYINVTYQYCNES
jgi:hypothetical protein